MTFSLPALFGIAISYLLLLFGVAWASERGLVPERWLRHPLAYILSLGVYAGAWAFFGAVDLAFRYGYGFLAYYAGTASLLLFAPLIVVPLMRISRAYQLNSLADLLSFRYRSPAAGVLVTLCMMIAVMPLLALQIRAVATTASIITSTDLAPEHIAPSQHILAQAFCALIMLFTLMFGARHVGNQERHNGLVAAIAFESLVKLSVLTLLGFAAVFGVFDSPLAMQRWLEAHPAQLQQLATQFDENETRALLLMFFASALALPHMYHMMFAENPRSNAIAKASWGFPLLMLLLSLPVLPILWAGIEIKSPLSPQYYALSIGIGLKSPLLTALTFVGGLAAASGTIVVITLALTSMCLNHLILPVYQPRKDRDIYRWLLWIRRALICAIIVVAYLSYRLLAIESLSGAGFATFTATLQFLPGILALLYWPGANRNGLIGGLAVGFSVWFATLLLPIVSEGEVVLPQLLPLFSDIEAYWASVAVLSLGSNLFIFVLASLLTSTSDEERTAAELCSQDDLNRPVRQQLAMQSAHEMRDRLAKSLGSATAEREITRALNDLDFTLNEKRPYALRRLRDRIEANLSGLLGPSVAHDIVNRQLPYLSSGNAASEDIYLIENRLENYKVHLTGLAAELDSLRRYHRETLQHLPLGVCSLGNDNELVMWNTTMQELTGIDGGTVIGSRLDNLPQPWRSLLEQFAQDNESHIYKRKIIDAGKARWISLHKARNEPRDPRRDASIIILEDVTELALLEEELIHSERLASIGRLAAGVAHEVGNPVTGIACLAQNLKYDSDSPAVHESAREIVKQTDRIKTIVQSLVNFAHSGAQGHQQEFGPVSLQECVQEAINLLQLNREQRQVRYQNRVKTSDVINGDAQRILQVFINLLSNARDASPEDGLIRIESQPHGDMVEIRVIDQGGGIPKAMQDQIFDPFFTTKDVGEGTGLGLALVYSIVEEHRGQVFVESPSSTATAGACFVLRLPRL
jgi:PAS domain S-box-containing protein